MQHIRSKTKHDKLIFVLVSLFLALCLLFATACQPGDEDSSSSSSSDSEETEITLPITNGHFTDLTDTSESGSYPRSPRNWSYAGDSLNSETASTSGTTYGVVNTTDDRFDAYKNNWATDTLSDFNEDKTEEEIVSIPNPRTIFSELADLDPESPEYADKLAELQAAYPDYADILADEEMRDEYILMIVNRSETATRYQSAVLTLPANAYMKISVLVNAFWFDGTDFAAFPEGKGAQISVSGNVDATTTLRNISTYAQTDGTFDPSENWVVYNIYLKGSPSSSQSVYLNLGLGTQGASDTSNYTEGYAFFDQATLSYITPAEYEAAVLDDSGDVQVANYYAARSAQQIIDEVPVEDRHVFDAAESGETLFVYDFTNAADDRTGSFLFTDAQDEGFAIDSINVSDKLLEDYHLNEDVESGLASIDDPMFTDELFDVTKTFTVLDENGDPVEDEDGNEVTEDRKVGTLAERFPFADRNVYYIFNPGYYASRGLSLGTFTAEPYMYYRLSLWVKSSALSTGTLNLRLLDRANNEKYEITGINTTDFNLTGDEEADPLNDSKYADWTQYTFYIYGGIYGGSDLELQLWMGVYDARNLNFSSFPNAGNYLLATNLQLTEITNSDFSSASSGDTVATGTISGEGTLAVTNGNFNNVTGADTYLRDEVGAPANWTKLPGQTGTDENDDPVYAKPGDIVTGVFSVQDMENYSGTLAERIRSLLQNGDNSLGIEAGELFNVNRLDNWDPDWNPNVLMIGTNVPASYGYRSPSLSFSANTYNFVDVRVRAVDITGDASVWVYLTDADGEILNVEGYVATYYTEEDQEVIDGDKTTDDVKYTTAAETGPMQVKVTGAEDGWVRCRFYVAAGAAISYNIEVWAGSKDGSELNQGIVLVDRVVSGTFSDEQSFTDAKEAYESLPEDERAAQNLFFADTSDYYTDPGTSGDTGTDDDVDDGTDDTTSTPFDWAMLTTLILALALLAALVAILVRRWKKSASERKLRKIANTKTEASYSRNRVRPVRKVIKKTEDGKEVEVEEPVEDEDLPEDAEPEESGEESEAAEAETQPESETEAETEAEAEAQPEETPSEEGGSDDEQQN